MDILKVLGDERQHSHPSVSSHAQIVNAVTAKIREMTVGIKLNNKKEELCSKRMIALQNVQRQQGYDFKADDKEEWQLQSDQNAENGISINNAKGL